MDGGRDHDGNHGHQHHGDRHPHEGHGHGPDDRRGPKGTEFLDLEISKVAHAEASSLTREAVRAILTGAIEARLRERLGSRLEAIGRIAADELADDLEANLDIEARIAARHEQREASEGRIRQALRAPAGKAPSRRKPR